MTARETILARIREALREPAPRVEDASGTPGREWLPDSGSTHDARLARFAENCTALRTTLVRCADDGAARAALRGIALEQKWSTVAAQGDPLVARVLQGIGLPVLGMDSGYDPDRLEACPAGITTCEALVAQTGSVLVTSRHNGGRALSVLPPHHVVVASESQLVGDLADAMHLVRERHGAAWPSMLSFITGPSRTGDIERILVLGAHGPKQLTVLLIA
jgi:L-lactate dehydrogenase complex protein LldG